MRKHLLALAVAVAGITAVATTAPAASVIDEPFTGGSWGQRFNESGVGTFDFMALTWVSGSTFEHLAFRNFSAGGWTVADDLTAKNAVAMTGSSTTSVDFDIIFNDPQQPTSFKFFAYYGNARREAALATWNGGWSFVPLTDNPDRDALLQAAGVPLPTAAFMALPLLAAMGVIARRRRAVKV